jgi:hypothetical protein
MIDRAGGRNELRVWFRLLLIMLGLSHSVPEIPDRFDLQSAVHRH